jgi:hypothetical protein
MRELAHQELGVLSPGLELCCGGAFEQFSDPVPDHRLLLSDG